MKDKTIEEYLQKSKDISLSEETRKLYLEKAKQRLGELMSRYDQHNDIIQKLMNDKQDTSYADPSLSRTEITSTAEKLINAQKSDQFVSTKHLEKTRKIIHTLRSEC